MLSSKEYDEVTAQYQPLGDAARPHLRSIKFVIVRQVHDRGKTVVDRVNVNGAVLLDAASQAWVSVVAFPRRPGSEVAAILIVAAHDLVSLCRGVPCRAQSVVPSAI